MKVDLLRIKLGSIIRKEVKKCQNKPFDLTSGARIAQCFGNPDNNFVLSNSSVVRVHSRSVFGNSKQMFY